jgi:putative zinc finger protein
MAHPEHDAAFGRLAAARLRAASADVRLDAHPDAETWAAYADGGLLADEVVVLDAHLAACPSCRQLMAALAPEPAEGALAPELADTPGPARVLPFRPRVTWVWMAAAAGLLGAVTMWSVMRLQQPLPATTMAERTMPVPPPAPVVTPPAEEKAVAQPPADALRSSSAVPPAAAPVTGAAPARTDELDRARSGLEKKTLDAADQRRDRLEGFGGARPAAPPPAPASKPEAAAGGAPAARVAANEPVVAVTQTAPSAVATRAPATPGVHGPAVNTQQQNMQALNAQAQTAAGQDAALQARAAQAAARAREQEKERAAAPAEAPRQASARPPLPAAPPPPAAPSPPAREPQAVGAIAETVSVASAPPRSGARSQGFGAAKRDAGASRDRAEADLADASAVAVEFAEPGGRLRWRIAGGSRIESSSDAGVTWTARYPATPERLRAGSAPAIDAAWVVGERGLVLRFAVPGSWAAVSRPAPVTLVAVTAGSAEAARVTAEDGRVFETSDGGRSWRPVTEAPR